MDCYGGSRRYILTGLLLLGLAQATWAVGPSRTDWLITGAGLGVAGGVEVLVKRHCIPDTARFTTPPLLDQKLRRALWWGPNRQTVAQQQSDGLIYGVFMSSLVWAPLLAIEPQEALYINARVFTVNSLATNLVKILAARQRPYSYYHTGPSLGGRDRASFFSGHASVAFSQAVTNALILSDTYPEYNDVIWSSLLSLAGYTAYLRVAGDMHYFSDIVVGAGLGGLLGWKVTRALQGRFETDGGSHPEMMLRLKIPLG